MIGKLALQEGTLHNKIFWQAVNLGTKTTEYWKKLLYQVNVTEFEQIRNQCESNYTKWQGIVKQAINKEIIRNARDRT